MHRLFAAEFGRSVALAGLLGAADPEDIAQEAFVRVHRRLDGLADDQAAVAYLRTAIVNLCRSGFARQAMIQRVLGARGGHLVSATEVSSAEDEALPQLGTPALAALIQRLPRPQREAVVLRFWLDLSLAQIAAAMNVPIGTTKSHLSRAIRTLRAGIIQQEDR